MSPSADILAMGHNFKKILPSTKKVQETKVSRIGLCFLLCVLQVCSFRIVQLKVCDRLRWFVNGSVIREMPSGALGSVPGCGS